MLASTGVLRLAALLAALLALAAPGPVRAADWLDLWMEAGAGVDGNPARASGVSQQPSGFTSLLGRVRAQLVGESADAVVSLSEAGRLYPDDRWADTLASRLEVAGRAGLGGGVTAALVGVASDTRVRDGQLDRSAWRGEGSLGLRRGALQGSLAGGWTFFAPREPSLRPFRSGGPEAWLRLGWAPAEEHRLSLAIGGTWAGFPGWAASGSSSSTERDDVAGHLSAEWAWRGPALATLGLAFSKNRSTAPGGDFTRFRLAASGALELPLDLTLAARLALQWSHYPDPLLLAESLRLAEGMEALDQVEARLSRPLGARLEVSLSMAWYRAQGGAGVPGYQRTVATLALGWRSHRTPP